MQNGLLFLSGLFLTGSSAGRPDTPEPLLGRNTPYPSSADDGAAAATAGLPNGGDPSVKLNKFRVEILKRSGDSQNETNREKQCDYFIFSVLSVYYVRKLSCKEKQS